MNINHTVTHTAMLSAMLDERQIKRILAEAVAKHAGVSIDETRDVAVDLFKKDSSTGFYYEARVRITEDLTKTKPEAPAHNPVSFSGRVRAPIKAGDIIEWVERGDKLQGAVVMTPNSSQLMVGHRKLDEIIDVAGNSLMIIG